MTALMSASREAMMSGMATETIVESTRIMKKPKHSAHSARQGFVTAFDWLLTGSSLFSSPSWSIRARYLRGSRRPAPRCTHRERSCCRAHHRREPETMRSEEHTSELQSRFDLVCRLLLE